MPKLIDHDIKKLDIAQAAWKIIIREGARGASVRNIAKEAGITLGALRYYFTTQEELLAFTEELVHEKITEKAAEHFMADLDPRDKILELLMGLLPEAEEELSASKARLIFKLQSRSSSYDPGRDSVYQAVKSVMSNLVMLNLLKKDTDLSLETDRLFAMMEGLVMEGVMQGSGYRRDKARKIIKMHLTSICKPESGNLY